VLLGLDQNFVYGFLIVAPPLLAIVVCWSVWRWAKRDEARQARDPDEYDRS